MPITAVLQYNVIRYVNTPPLEKFPQVSDLLDESFATETEPEGTDLDTSFCSRQADYTTE